MGAIAEVLLALAGAACGVLFVALFSNKRSRESLIKQSRAEERAKIEMRQQAAAEKQGKEKHLIHA